MPALKIKRRERVNPIPATATVMYINASGEELLRGARNELILDALAATSGGAVTKEDYGGNGL
jgi:hypothetical protein